MNKKILLPLFFSSAVMLMWACGEGDISYADDQDIMVKTKMEEASDYEIAERFMTYCNSKEGKKNNCNGEYLVSSSLDDASSSSRRERSRNGAA